MTLKWMRYSAVVDSHLPEGFTKLRIHAGGDLYFDVPTDVIPSHLRNIGSKVVLCLDASTLPNSPDEMRALRKQAILVEEPAVEERR